jgi:hypothetical protein
MKKNSTHSVAPAKRKVLMLFLLVIISISSITKVYPRTPESPTFEGKDAARLWKLTTGIESGSFLHLKSGKVVIEKGTGELLNIPWADLSEYDKDYIQKQNAKFSRYLTSDVSFSAGEKSKSLAFALIYLIFGLGIFIAGWRLYVQTKDMDFRMAIIVITFSGSSLFFVASRGEVHDEFVAGIISQTEVGNLLNRISSNP